MKKEIKTYEDLLVHKHQLETLLDAQKQLIQLNFQDVKKAAGRSAKDATKIFTRDTSNFFLVSGANRVIDMVVRNLILSRAGWFTRFVVPFVIKNFASHYIADNKDKWYKKLFSFVGHKNGKAKHGTQN